MEKYVGLSDNEVNVQLTKHGYNELPEQKPQTFIQLIISVIKEPMLFLLLAAGVIYFLLGEPKDAMVLMVSVLAVIGITIYQERKTEKALQALRDLSSPRALVIRNGQQMRIPGREVVVGDTILIQEGDRVPADAVVINSQNLMVDESLLTGESLPVRKIAEEGEDKAAMEGENSSRVFSGTLIAQGSGVAIVKAVGISTEMGKIGKTLQSLEDEDSLLKREITKIVRIFGIAGIIACIALIIIHTVIYGSLLNGFLAGLTLSMAMLPEEFPVVLMIFLTLGAWRISKKKVLTRNNQAIETLGATSVLCVDKTGTLTFNRMELSGITSSSGEKMVSDLNDSDENSEYLEILKYSKLASKRGAFDPLEKEINSLYEKIICKESPPLKDWHLLKEYQITKDLFAVTRIWSSPETDSMIVGTKGAPEAIMELCAFNSIEKEEMMKIVQKMADKGERVLGVAKALYHDRNFPATPREIKFTFLGFLGFVDPIRPTVYESVMECYKAGIRVIMITGDYPGTARYIAAQAGIINTDKYLTGKDLEKMSVEELREKINDVNIFARMVPEQKLKIIDALKANREIVAMTGDGVNDGPALKTAHIGIAMGERGTDVARESADLVLLNDDFTSIVSAVKLGRRIYDNLQKAVSYIFSIHIPIAGVALLPTFFNLPIVLLPVHIAFLELVIDPACSTVYESENSEEAIMNRPPRDIKKPLFANSHVLVSLFQGVTLLGVIMAVFLLSVYMGKDEGTSRSMAFITMVVCNLILIYANLSKKSVFQKLSVHRNNALYLISISAMVVIALIMNVNVLRELFHFAPITFDDSLIIFAMSIVCFVWLEFFKIFRTPENQLLNS